MPPPTFLRPGDTDVAPRMPSANRLPRLLLYAISQVLVFMVMFQIYKMVRKSFIGHAEPIAFDNALDVLHLESSLQLDFELSLQQWILNQPHCVIVVFNQFYANYMYVFDTCMVLSIFFAVERWRYLRRWFYISMVLATPLYLIYPLAPPRLMQPYGFPFVDTMQVFGPNYFSTSGLLTANRYAAMPSMHVGWTTLAAIALAACLPCRRIGLCIAAFLIAAITTTVIVTANHYWLDALAGWILIALAALVNRLLPYPLPIHWPWNRRSSEQSHLAI